MRAFGLVTAGLFINSDTGSDIEASDQDRLNRLEAQVEFLSERLGAAQQRVSRLEHQVSRLDDAVHGLSDLSKIVEITPEGDLALIGVNLRLQSGLGLTHLGNGRGNIILGYGSPTPDSTGSHNLIIGDGHTVNSHSGIVTGRDNTIAGPHAVALGGVGCTAKSNAIAIGGLLNQAEGANSVVIGGRDSATLASESSILNGAHTQTWADGQVIVGHTDADD